MKKVSLYKEIKIDKNIPLPNKCVISNLYPFASMEIGDSIFIPNKKSADIGSYYSNWRPKRFSSRTVVEHGKRGVRIWRIA